MLSLISYDPNGFLFCVIPQLNAVYADCETVFFPVMRPEQDLQQHLIAIHRDELFYDVGAEWGYGMLFAVIHQHDTCNVRVQVQIIDRNDRSV